jgi:hypothetical protein
MAGGPEGQGDAGGEIMTTIKEAEDNVRELTRKLADMESDESFELTRRAIQAARVALDIEYAAESAAAHKRVRETEHRQMTEHWALERQRRQLDLEALKQYRAELVEMERERTRATVHAMSLVGSAALAVEQAAERVSR